MHLYFIKNLHVIDILGFLSFVSKSLVKKKAKKTNKNIRLGKKHFKHILPV